jgi:hypothetical protein
MSSITRFGRLSLALTLALFASTSHAQSSSVTGDWQGALNAGGITLHLVLHLHTDSAGALTGTLDSIDQGAKGIPITKAELKDGKLTLDLDMIHGHFVGAVNAAASEITGEWTQLNTLPLAFHRVDPRAQTASKPAPPTSYDGNWTGVLTANGQQLHLAIHIANLSDGLHVTLDSLDQGAMGIPASSVTQDTNGIRIAFAALDAKIEGHIGSSPDSMDSTFTQRGATLPLPLKRVNSGK